MLMDFVVGAVVEHRFRIVSADQALFQKIEEARQAEPIEELKHRAPFSKFRGERPPSWTVDHHIPKSIEVVIGDSGTSCMDYVVVSNPEFLDLIF